MNQSEQINELAKALSQMQGSVGAVFKNKTAKVQMKSGGTYTYTYADLAGIWDSIRKPLSDAGLSVCQTFCDNLLVTMLMHSSGQWIKSSLPLNCMGLKPQELGSEITYLKRYALSSILGISADEDDDGETAQQAERRPPANAAPTPPTNSKTISINQAKELESMLAECDSTYQKNFWSYLKLKFNGITKLSEIPVDHYVSVWVGISRKREENVKDLHVEEVAYA